MKNTGDHSPSSTENQDHLDLDLDLSLSLPKPRPQPQPQLQPQPLQPQPHQYAPLLQETNFWALPPYTNTPIMPLPYQPYGIMQQPEPPHPLVPHQFHGMPEPVLLPELKLPSLEQLNQDQEPQGETITPPYQWATSTPAKVYSLDHLLSHSITSITGTVQCKKCKEQYEIEFNLEEKFGEVSRFIEENCYKMHDRATQSWTMPLLPTCNSCGQENSMKPVITKKRKINWLFLFLGQMIGCCTIPHLKYFCKHTRNHRTGAKDRLIYLTYLDLYKQLKPDNGLFD